MKSNYSNLYIRGNLTLKQDALMVMGNTQYGGNVAAALRVIGGLNGANGDVVMEEGSSLVFSSFGGTDTFRERSFCILLLVHWSICCQHSSSGRCGLTEFKWNY
jgi:hypothetical protein